VNGEWEATNGDWITANGEWEALNGYLSVRYDYFVAVNDNINANKKDPELYGLPGKAGEKAGIFRAHSDAREKYK